MPIQSDVSLSVVLPAYNEEQNIPNTLPAMVADLRRQLTRFEILLIDDCSQDRTFAIASDLAAKYPEIRLLRNETNLRQGGTLERGFALATMDIVTHNAMDYPFHYDDLPLVLDELEHADVVVCGRKSYPGITLPRQLVSWTNRTILRVLFGTSIVDYNFVQFYKRAVIQGMHTFSTATSFITPEKIIRAARSGCTVVEVPATYHERVAGKPSSANWKNIRRALADMARLRVELWRHPKQGN
jgi:glycosyltransferase involved in cell wall biosynthesis